MTRRMTDEEKKKFSDDTMEGIRTGKYGLYERNICNTMELYFPNEVIYVTPIICSNPNCRADMGCINSLEKSTCDMLHQRYINYLCPACHAKLMGNMGYKK